MEVYKVGDLKLSNEIINSKIDVVHYFNLEHAVRNTEPIGSKYLRTKDNLERVTVCVVVMKNGFVVVGQSACLNISSFNETTGRELAYEDAYSKIWEVMGYHYRDERWRSEQVVPGNERA